MAITISLAFPTIIFKPFTSSTPKPHITKLTTRLHSSLSTSKTTLLSLISDQKRGLTTQNHSKRLSQIIEIIEEMALHARGTVTTNESLSGTWRLLWTTEKEQLFIIKNAGFFGTEAGDVLQVIDVQNKVLNNVITFPPNGVFFVRSSLEVASNQRINFRYA